MPTMLALSSNRAGCTTALMMQYTVSHTMVPIILKLRCTRAARRAFLLVPNEERSAVTQVPIFCPMMIGIAAP